MKSSPKPVRKCHACPLNLGDHCWLYDEPRQQWQSAGGCPGRNDEESHARFRAWEKQPDIKTRREVRREILNARKRKLNPRTESSHHS